MQISDHGELTLVDIDQWHRRNHRYVCGAAVSREVIFPLYTRAAEGFVYSPAAHHTHSVHARQAGGGKARLTEMKGAGDNQPAHAPPATYLRPV